MEKQCYWIYRADLFFRKLTASKMGIVRAIGGMGINLTMSYSYVTVLTIGESYAKKQKKGAKK